MALEKSIPDYIDQICRQLDDNTLTSIRLDEPISQAAFDVMLVSLTRCTSICSLRLLGIGPRRCADLGLFLRSTRSLEEFEFCFNEPPVGPSGSVGAGSGDAGMTALFRELGQNPHQCIRTLRFGNNKCSVATLRILTDALTPRPGLPLSSKVGVESLSICEEKFSPELCAEGFGPLLQLSTSLKHLSLVSCGITDQALIGMAVSLVNNTTLVDLDLSQNSITDSGITSLCQSLVKNSSVRRIFVFDNQITNASLKPLSTLFQSRSQSIISVLGLAGNLMDQQTIQTFETLIYTHQQRLRSASSSSSSS